PRRLGDGFLKAGDAVIVGSHSEDSANDSYLALSSKSLNKIVARKLSADTVVGADVTDLAGPRSVVVHNQHRDAGRFCFVQHRSYFGHSSRHNRQDRNLF